ncbi:MAG TPA: alpha/beta hydrolase [Chryseolinea sp.]
MVLKHIIALLFVTACFKLSAQTDSVYLWPNAVPGEAGPKKDPVPTTLDDGSIRVVEVTNPFIAVFEPKRDVKNGKAIIVCPGGAYVRLAVHKEGYATAEWLARLGYTAFVLHYRVPEKRHGALQDLQRSLRLVRQHAKDYGIDPHKVGAIGFSAGADLVARSAMTVSLQPYPAQDSSDKLSAIPDRMMLIYPAYLDGGSNHSLTPSLKATQDTPDTFIFQTMDDGSAHSAFAVAAALRNANANVELHMLPTGGHGYGMTAGNRAAEAWPKLLEVWLQDHL